MDAVTTLPQGYSLYDRIDLQTDKQTLFKVNTWAVVGLVAMVLLGHFAFVPITSVAMLDFVPMMLRLAVMFVGYIAYIVLHELTHAAAMKLFKASDIRFGFTGLYAYAGSERDYFGKAPYRVIALAPLFVWTLLLTVPLILLPADWFWTVYFIQCGNIAGCVGDIYVTVRLWKAPGDILVRDTGVEMFVYSRQGNSGYVNKKFIR